MQSLTPGEIKTVHYLASDNIIVIKLKPLTLINQMFIIIILKWRERQVKVVIKESKIFSHCDKRYSFIQKKINL